jgi:glycosyltransferase involved in cell wall biosynthesis
MHDIVPIKMYEYMAMGKPIVATKLYGVMTEFGDGNGVVYADSPDEVVQEAIKLLNSNTIKQKGEWGRAFVQSTDWMEVTDQYEKTIETLIL